MLRLAFDENFNFDTVRGLMQRTPDLEIMRVQDKGKSITCRSSEATKSVVNNNNGAKELQV